MYTKYPFNLPKTDNDCSPFRIHLGETLNFQIWDRLCSLLQFSVGLLEITGHYVCPNKALDYRVLYIILSNLNKMLLNKEIHANKKRWLVLLEVYLTTNVAASLRVNKGLTMEAHGLTASIYYGKNLGKQSHMVNPSLGHLKIKQEINFTSSLLLPKLSQISSFKNGWNV